MSRTAGPKEHFCGSGYYLQPFETAWRELSMLLNAVQVIEEVYTLKTD